MAAGALLGCGALGIAMITQNRCLLPTPCPPFRTCVQMAAGALLGGKAARQELFSFAAVGLLEGLGMPEKLALLTRCGQGGACLLHCMFLQFLSAPVARPGLQLPGGKHAAWSGRGLVAAAVVVNPCLAFRV